MKETAYWSQLRNKLVKATGGLTYKMADSSSLGRPDSFHIKDGIITVIETKIGKNFHHTETVGPLCFPWKEVNDRRQFEVCKEMSREGLVLYAIYYPKIKYTAVLEVNYLNEFRMGLGADPKPLEVGPNFVAGHGIELIVDHIKQNRRKVYARLDLKLRKISEGIS
jgi:hypothetical protein